MNPPNKLSISNSVTRAVSGRCIIHIVNSCVGKSWNAEPEFLKFYGAQESIP
jgi:hypothetical protein